MSLPKGWVEAAIGDLGEYLNGLAFKPTDWTESGTPIIRIQNLTDKSKPHNLTRRQVPTEYMVQPGDILVSWSATLDAFIWDREPAILNQHIFRVFPESKLVDKAFLFHCLRIAIAEMKKSEHLHGTTMKHINRGPFLAHTVHLPPLPEQRRIVAKLDALLARVRKARESLDRLPAMLDTMRQSVLAAAFRGDLTKEWREAHPDVEPAEKLLERILIERRRRWEESLRAKGRDPAKAKYVEPEPVDVTNLPELPEGWVWASVDHLLKSITAGKSPKTLERPPNADELGVLKVSAVSWGSFDPSESKALQNAANPPSNTHVRAGDLLISRANTVELVGAVVLVERDYPRLFLSDKTLRLNSIVVDRRYLLFALRSHWARRAFEGDATGTSDSMRNITQKTIRSVPVPLPPLEEQVVIAGQLERADALRLSLLKARQFSRTRLDSLEQSLLAKAFRGELVPQDPSDEPASVLLERIRAERAAEEKPRRKRKVAGGARAARRAR